MTFDQFFAPNAQQFLALAQRDLPGASLIEQQWQANRIAWTTFKQYYSADAAAAEAVGNVPPGVASSSMPAASDRQMQYASGPADTGQVEAAGQGAAFSPMTMLALVALAGGGYWYFNRKH